MFIKARHGAIVAIFRRNAQIKQQILEDDAARLQYVHARRPLNANAAGLEGSIDHVLGIVSGLDLSAQAAKKFGSSLIHGLRPRTR